MALASKRSSGLSSWRIGLGAGLPFALASTPGWAADPAPGDVTLQSCAAVPIALERLNCYDRIAGRAPAPGVPASAPTGLQATPSGGVQVAPSAAAAAAAGTTGAAAVGPAVTPAAGVAPVPSVAGSGLVLGEPEEPSLMSEFWELDDKDKRGTFRFLSYQPNYVLPMHYTSSINQNPTSPAPDHTGSLPPYRHVELKMQISLRTKIAQGLLLPNADLWFGYTQRSLWQLWNKQESSPFRSTDYNPEAVYVISVPKSLRTLPLGWQFRMVQAGIAHESNGQTKPYSRSWNRVYLGAGFEKDNLALTVHAQKRLREDPAQDDNPDLISYRGHGDIGLVWTPGKATTSVTWRTNFKNTQRGSWQFDFTYPVDTAKPKGLRWYVQVFSGYGESLIDYNFRQTSVGAGLSLFEF